MTVTSTDAATKAGEGWLLDWDDWMVETDNYEKESSEKTGRRDNYPNPFNPTTVINELSANVHVSLKLYDLLGKEVMTLVDEPQTSGYHQITVDGSNLANGVYFYRIIAGSFVDTKKILLVK